MKNFSPHSKTILSRLSTPACRYPQDKPHISPQTIHTGKREKTDVFCHVKNRKSANSFSSRKNTENCTRTSEKIQQFQSLSAFPHSSHPLRRRLLLIPFILSFLSPAPAGIPPPARRLCVEKNRFAPASRSIQTFARNPAKVSIRQTKATKDRFPPSKPSPE